MIAIFLLLFRINISEGCTADVDSFWFVIVVVKEVSVGGHECGLWSWNC